MTDLEIAQSVNALNIKDIANKLDIDESLLTLYGNDKAKLDLSILEKEDRGNLILVTAISPTPAGEGKSTTTIGLADGLQKIGKKSIVCLREPSLGPVMGVKGGACGGGYAQVIPMEDINLHFTGDLHAITTANNAICALIDNHIFQGNQLNIDPTRIIIHRVLDMNDRALRNVIIGLGGPTNGVPREDHFDITVASEVMAILCLAKDSNDFKERIKNMVIAYTYDKLPVTVGDLKVEGAIALLMKDALKPNLVQTLEHTPAIIHGGPFANIAHGCNSLIATKMGLKLADYTITEAGFGCDLGAEKFFDIKSRIGSLNPKCVVLVATIRALKMHGGVLKEDLATENIDALKAGLCNLERHCENIKKFGLNFVIAINKFFSDTTEEINVLLEFAKEHNYEISLSEGFGKGSEGTIDLANKVVKICSEESIFKYLYDENLTIKKKIEIICKEIYGASKVNYSTNAKNQIARMTKLGYDKLPICMAKTQYSFSDNPKLLGAPTDFEIEIRDVLPAIGAGFIVCLTGDIMRMPGLPKAPAALNMDLVDGKVKGLF